MRPGLAFHFSFAVANEFEGFTMEQLHSSRRQCTVHTGTCKVQYYPFLVTKARVTVDCCWRPAGSKKKEKSVFSACVIGVGD